MTMRIRCLLPVLVTGALALACDSAGETPDALLEPHEGLSDQECSVCGMSVAMQPAPRAQVLHRDGERLFFCSIADWQLHLGAPSPHGKVLASFIEVVGADEDPANPGTGHHAWIPAQNATFVLGVERLGVMGKPVLAHRERSEAESIWGGHPEARIVDLAELTSWWRSTSSKR